jgi:hypothetical protein
MAKIKCGCSYPNEKGWHLDEQIITTRREQKIEQAKTEREMLGWFLNVYYKKGETGLNALATYLEATEDREPEVFYEWEM